MNYDQSLELNESSVLLSRQEVRFVVCYASTPFPDNQNMWHPPEAFRWLQVGMRSSSRRKTAGTRSHHV